MSIRELTCDTCGITGRDLSGNGMWEWGRVIVTLHSWFGREGVTTPSGRHGCPDCAPAILSAEPGLVARGTADGGGRYWIIRDSGGVPTLYVQGPRGSFDETGSPIDSVAELIEEALAW